MTLIALTLFGCGSEDPSAEGAPVAARTPRDAAPDGLFRDFMDGKYDGVGHPLDAEVWEAELDCKPTTGASQTEARRFAQGAHAAGVACRATSKTIGLGRFTLNVRALVEKACSGSACDLPVFTAKVKTPAGATLEEKALSWASFPSALTYANVPLRFTHATSGAVELELTWNDQVDARLDYVELFRATQNVLITPSQVFAPGAQLEVEAQDAPKGFSLGYFCNGSEQTDSLDALFASGAATREDTDFRSVFRFVADDLVETCPLPSRLRFTVTAGGFTRAQARISLFEEEPPCTFAPNTTRVMLTGFEPFPADSTHDNSSERAVVGFDPKSVPGISVMKLTLPVEYDTAPGIAASAIARCNPDIVIGFGQGRSEVDLETTAYNTKNSAELSGGFADNRGHIAGGEAIVGGGPAELPTGLPKEAIFAALTQSGIAVGYSDDPGRFVCNNLFYRIMTESAGKPRVSGFVHLPYIHTVDAADQKMLDQVVRTAVSAAVKKHQALP